MSPYVHMNDANNFVKCTRGFPLVKRTLSFEAEKIADAKMLAIPSQPNMGNVSIGVLKTGKLGYRYGTAVKIELSLSNGATFKSNSREKMLLRVTTVVTSHGVLSRFNFELTTSRWLFLDAILMVHKIKHRSATIMKVG